MTKQTKEELQIKKEKDFEYWKKNFNPKKGIFELALEIYNKIDKYDMASPSAKRASSIYIAYLILEDDIRKKENDYKKEWSQKKIANIFGINTVTIHKNSKKILNSNPVLINMIKKEIKK